MRREELIEFCVQAFKQNCPIAHPNRPNLVGLKEGIVCPYVNIIGFGCTGSEECAFVKAFRNEIGSILYFDINE